VPRAYETLNPGLGTKDFVSTVLKPQSKSDLCLSIENDGRRVEGESKPSIIVGGP